MTNPIGVYLHLPFCVHRCSYCDFFSSTDFTEGAFRRVQDSILSEIDAVAREGMGFGRIRSVFFGGGTPSLFPVDSIRAILEKLELEFGFCEDAEVTLEANPETVTETFARDLFSSTSVNRISLGVQSFQPKFLQLLERRATPEHVRLAVELFRQAGFENLSLDLIFGIPGQSWSCVEADLLSAIELAPQHMSAYQLTLKPGHKLFSELPTDDEVADLYERLVDRLSGLGLGRYEISNYSLPNRRSQHNLTYWQGGDYLGFGPSASSRLFRDGRFQHHKNPSDLGLFHRRTKDPWVWEGTTHFQTVLEGCFLNLRTIEGVEVREFAERYRYDLCRAGKFEDFKKEGWIEYDGERLKLTPKGLLLADYLGRELVDPSLCETTENEN